VNNLLRLKDRAVFDFARANWPAVEAALSDWEPGVMNETEHLEAEAVKLQELMGVACKKYIPRKVVHTDRDNWWNFDIARSRAIARGARKRFKSERDNVRRLELRYDWKERRALYKKLISEAKKKHFTDKIDALCENDSWSKVWEMLRRLGAGKGDVGLWSENATYTTEQ